MSILMPRLVRESDALASAIDVRMSQHEFEFDVRMSQHMRHAAHATCVRSTNFMLRQFHSHVAARISRCANSCCDMRTSKCAKLRPHSSVCRRIRMQTCADVGGIRVYADV